MDLFVVSVLVHLDARAEDVFSIAMHSTKLFTCAPTQLHKVVRDAQFDLEAIALACDNDLGPYENILLQVKHETRGF